MRRTTRLSGFLLTSLSTLLLGCGGSSENNPDAGPPDASMPDAGPPDASMPDASMPDAALTCQSPEELCEDSCVDTTTSSQHCGACGTPCVTGDVCQSGLCVNSIGTPLAAIQTQVIAGKELIAGDLFVLKGASFDLTKVNTATFAAGRVIDHAVLPGGDLLLATAEETEGRIELYRATPDGSTINRVSPALGAGSNIEPGFVVSADGSTVLYRANQDNTAVIELYAIRLASPGTSVKVSGPLVTDGEVTSSIAISADGTRAAYIADQETEALFEIYTVDLSTPTPGVSTKLNPEPLTQSIRGMAMTPDGATVVYRNADTLRAVATNAPQIAAPFEEQNNSITPRRGLQITTDGTTVFFLANNSLWKASLAGPFDTAIIAEEIVTVNTGFLHEDFVVSNDGQSVFYRQTETATTGNYKLFRVDLNNIANPIRLSSQGTASADKVTDFALSADETAVVFRTGADGAEGGLSYPDYIEQSEVTTFAPALRYIDLTQAIPALAPQISEAADEGEQGVGPGYVVTSTGDEIVYRADHTTANIYGAFHTTSDGATVTDVTPKAPDTNVSDLTLFGQ